MVLLAVYGTLRKGYRNHLTLSKHGAQLKGGAWIPNHVIFQDGWFPAAVEFHGGRVWCEVYEVPLNCIRDTDKVEGVAHGLYERIRVATDFGMAYMYRQIREYKEDWIGNLWFPEGRWTGENPGPECVPWTGEANEARLLAELSKRWEGPPTKLGPAEIAEISTLLRAQDKANAISAANQGAEYQPPPRQLICVKDEGTETKKEVYVQVTIPYSRKYKEVPFDPDRIFDKASGWYGQRERVLADVRRHLGTIPDKPTEVMNA